MGRNSPLILWVPEFNFSYKSAASSATSCSCGAPGVVEPLRETIFKEAPRLIWSRKYKFHRPGIMFQSRRYWPSMRCERLLVISKIRTIAPATCRSVENPGQKVCSCFTRTVIGPCNTSSSDGLLQRSCPRMSIPPTAAGNPDVLRPMLV